MSDALFDQIKAANADTRAGVARVFGLPTDRPTRGTSTFIDELLLAHVDDPRCSHLVTRPIRPAYWNAMTGWLCESCIVIAAQARRAMGPDAMPLGPVEEFTCDRCRKYSPNGLSSAVLRQDFWVMAMGFCARCTQEFHDSGAQHVTLPPNAPSTEETA